MDFLLDYPRAWSIDSERAAHGYKGEGDADQEIEEGTDSEDESEAEDDSDADAEGGNDAPGFNPNAQPSPAFREFLGFLELGCAGYAVEGYQLVLVVVAGIPETVSVALVADHWHQVPYFGYYLRPSIYLVDPSAITGFTARHSASRCTVVSTACAYPSRATCNCCLAPGIVGMPCVRRTKSL